MSQKIRFADLHCHPAMRPLNLETNQMWEPNDGRQQKKAIKHQLQGKRGAAYNQSGMPKLQTGATTVVFASLYPIEKGFMTNNSILLHALNIGTLIISLPLLVVQKYFSFRDFLFKGFIKFPKKRIVKIKRQDYWEGFMQEVDLYRAEHNLTKAIGDKSQEEIKQLLSHAGLPTDALQDRGIFSVADKNFNPNQIPENKLISILTIEGMGIVSQENAPSESIDDLPLRVLPKVEIMRRCDVLKNDLPIFFITFCHHFDNGLCGHARSMPVIAQKLGALNQSSRISLGFNALGFEVLCYLLGVKKQGGKMVKNLAAGRRIFIDVKHMSLQGRLTLYEVIESYNTHHPNDKIPIIASHVGYSGLSVFQMVQNILNGDENDKNQINKSSDHSPARFNQWSINIGTEEIKKIIDSGGLIGLSLEQNILGVGFFEKLKNVQDNFNTYLVLHQLQVMAKASGTSNFWDHVMIGTDYDGVINPVDDYTSALFFTKLREDLLDLMTQIPESNRAAYFLPSKDPDPDQDRNRLATDIIDKFCFGNAHAFLKKFMPVGFLPEFTAPIT